MLSNIHEEDNYEMLDDGYIIVYIVRSGLEAWYVAPKDFFFLDDEYFDVNTAAGVETFLTHIAKYRTPIQLLRERVRRIKEREDMLLTELDKNNVMRSVTVSAIAKEDYRLRKENETPGIKPEVIKANNWLREANNRLLKTNRRLLETNKHLRETRDQLTLAINTMISLSPALFIDFDDRILIDNYSEPIYFNLYVPVGWKGISGDFEDRIPDKDKYWVINGVNCFIESTPSGNLVM